MARLRSPDNGCPWDRQQDFASLIPYTLEEAYEVADAVEREDYADLRDELGDLLLQVAFHARLAEERALFDFEGVAEAICEKLCAGIPTSSRESNSIATRPASSIGKTPSSRKKAKKPVKSRKAPCPASPPACPR
jgi:NTP pyrophosphatase (non-canonical NTP hydrolase)